MDEHRRKEDAASRLEQQFEEFRVQNNTQWDRFGRKYEGDQETARTWRSNHDKLHQELRDTDVAYKQEVTKLLASLNERLKPLDTLRIQASPFLTVLKVLGLGSLGALAAKQGPTWLEKLVKHIVG